MDTGIGHQRALKGHQMKPRTGYLIVCARGYRARFRINGKSLFFDLTAADEAAARVEMQRIGERLSARDVVAVADNLRVMADRMEKENTASVIRLAQAWAEYLASRKRPASAPSTLSVYGVQFAQFATWAGDLSMDDVTPAIAERYAAHLDACPVKGGTVNKHLKVLRLVWRVLLPRRDNPWAGLKSHNPDTSTKHLPFTQDQLASVLNGACGEFGDLLWLLAYTGLRLVDACTLQVGSVHLNRRVIELYPAKTGSRGSNPMKAKIGIHSAIEPLLLSRAAGRVSGPVFPELDTLYRKDRSAVAKRIVAYLQGCGLVTRVESSRGRASCLYGAHSFRHTLQTELNNAEVHPMVADVILCHKTGSMGQHYSHVSDAKVVDAVERALPDLRRPVGQIIKMEAAS
jgi:integrase